MPLEYAILIVLGIYFVGGVACAHWIHRPRRSDRRPEGEDAD